MQKAVEIQSGGLTLRGMLHLPDSFTAKLPVVMIFHGFTGNKMEPHFIFVKLSRLLEKRGIASVRFDFGGSGESDGEFSAMTITGELKDAKVILDFVKSLDFCSRERLGVVGLSMGGVVASLLAGDCPDEIRALCLWAPAGNIKEYVTRGMSETDIKAFYEKGFKDAGGLAVGKNFIDDVDTLDLLQRAATYEKPVILIHGTADQTVPLQVSRQYLESYGSHARLHEIKDADHTFNKLDWEREVLEHTVDFMVDELILSSIR